MLLPPRSPLGAFSSRPTLAPFSLAADAVQKVSQRYPMEVSPPGSKEVIADEVPVQRMARESVVALVDMEPGAIISSDMVWVKRPGTGIPAREMEKVIGKRLKRAVTADSLLSWEDME